MRVMYLTMNPNRASTTTPTEGWFRVLRKSGLEPVLVSKELGALHEWASGEGIPSLQVDMPVPGEFTKGRLAAALWPLWRIALRYRPHIIHSNEQDLYPVAHYLGRICRRPVVVSAHFTMDRGFCEWAFAGDRRPARLFFVSEGSRDACRPGVEGIVPEDRWRVLPNGLDLTHFTRDEARGAAFRRDHGLQDSDLVAGVACALRPRKQLEHLVRAAAAIDEPRLKIAIAGGPVSGDEAYADALMKNARATLGNRLVVLGHLSELRGLYNALDIFINTSQEEACSISVIESLACGCPVLGYASKSVDGQILPDGGEIVPQDNVDALTAALRRWLSDPSRFSERRRNARRTAEERFDIRVVSAQLWEEYARLRA